jgi:hypothetical protein
MSEGQRTVSLVLLSLETRNPEDFYHEERAALDPWRADFSVDRSQRHGRLIRTPDHQPS